MVVYLEKIKSFNIGSFCKEKSEYPRMIRHSRPRPSLTAAGTGSDRSDCSSRKIAAGCKGSS